MSNVWTSSFFHHSSRQGPGESLLSVTERFVNNGRIGTAPQTIAALENVARELALQTVTSLTNEQTNGRPKQAPPSNCAAVIRHTTQLANLRAQHVRAAANQQRTNLELRIANPEKERGERLDLIKELDSRIIRLQEEVGIAASELKKRPTSEDLDSECTKRIKLEAEVKRLSSAPGPSSEELQLLRDHLSSFHKFLESHDNIPRNLRGPPPKRRSF
ncbi:hypothetical protein QBC39DRAFT_334783 [Podospora conica]|nr:hypothetical protein QBC39DRAFT_334783 [Schizothecium conicum]